MRQMSTLCRWMCLNSHRWWGWWCRLKAFSFVKLKALPEKPSKVCISLKWAASLNSTLTKLNIVPSSHVKLMKHRALLHVVISLAASSMSCLFTLNKTSSSYVVFFSEHMSCCCIEHFFSCDLMMRHLLRNCDGQELFWKARWKLLIINNIHVTWRLHATLCSYEVFQFSTLGMAACFLRFLG